MGFGVRNRPPSDSELARLADGSLPADRQAQLRAKVRASPELAAALAEQEHAVSLLRRVDERAPTALRMRIEAMSPGPTARARPRRIVLAAGAAAVAVTAAVLVAIILQGPALPSVSQTAKLALASETTGAPAEDAVRPGVLAVAVDRVSFPYWSASFGWRAVGVRRDVLSGRRITTVYYSDRSGARVGYSIVAGRALDKPAGEVLARRGRRFTLTHDGSLRIVIWLRSGHTCVLAGRGISDQALLRLASGNGHQSA